MYPLVVDEDGFSRKTVMHGDSQDIFLIAQLTSTEESDTKSETIIQERIVFSRNSAKYQRIRFQTSGQYCAQCKINYFHSVF
jgi:hypothetical protein